MPTAKAKKSNATSVNHVKESKQEIIKEIEEATHPDKMSKQEAIDYMEELIDDISVLVEGLRSEVDEERETVDE